MTIMRAMAAYAALSFSRIHASGDRAGECTETSNNRDAPVKQNSLNMQSQNWLSNLFVLRGFNILAA
jgi:hypothetical protein